jgi:hypothetical protein
MIGAGISVGMVVGCLISAFVGDLSLWIGVGMCLGVAGGAGLWQLKERLRT